MPAATFPIHIVAKDDASKRLDAINKRMQAFTRPARDLQASFARFSQAAGIPAITRNVDALRRSAFAATESLAKIVTPLGAITGAASVAGLYKLTSAWAAWGQQLEFSAQRIGISADQLQSFQGVARLAGSSAGAMTSGLTSLEDTMTDALGGRNNAAVTWLTALHVNFRKTALTAKSAADVFPQLRERLHAITNPSLQAKAAMVLLGGAAEDLLPVIRMSNGEYAEYTKWARQYGLVNGQAVVAARQLSMAQTRVELATEGLTNSIAASLAPVLTPMLGSLADWIGANRQIIAGRLDDYVKRLAGWLKGIDWRSIGGGIERFGSEVEQVAQMFGGWQRAAEGVAAVMGASWLARILRPILAVSSALTRVVLLTTAAGGGVAGRFASGVLGRGLTGAALDAAALPLFGVTAGFELGKVGIGRDDTLIRPAAPKGIEAKVRAEATRQGVDPDRAVSLMRVESGGRQDAISPAGAIGLFQLMPGTASDLGVNPFDPDQNIRGGIAYLKRLNKQFGGNWDATEAAYNAGPTNEGVRRYALTGDASHLPAETQRYVASVDATDAVVRPRLTGPSAEPSHDGASMDVASAGNSGDDGGFRELLAALREGNKQAVTVHVQHDNPPAGTRIRVAKAAPNVGMAMPADYAPGL